jgi:predicted ester cyclase
MSAQQTQDTMAAYLNALVQRGAFATYFTDAVTCTLVGSGQDVQGRAAVERFIRWFHEQAFDARVEVKGTIVGDGHAALEAEFVGTHTGEFQGLAPTGKPVQVPYAVLYDLEGARITALRIYLPLEMMLRQLG